MILELMNDQMRPLREAAEPLIALGALDQSLQLLLDAGLTVVDDCLYFTHYLAANPHLLDAPDLDRTGREALINKLHLDDLVDINRPGWATYCVAQGTLFAARVLAAGAALTRSPLDVAMTVDFGGTDNVRGSLVESYPSSTWRFYTRREDEIAWMTEDNLEYDPEALQQAVALFRRA